MWQSRSKAVNMGLNAFVTVTLNAHRLQMLDEFTLAVKAIPEILACYNTTGDGDFLLHIVANDVEDYEHLFNKISHFAMFSVSTPVLF